MRRMRQRLLPLQQSSNVHADCSICPHGPAGIDCASCTADTDSPNDGVTRRESRPAATCSGEASNPGTASPVNACRLGRRISGQTGDQGSCLTGVLPAKAERGETWSSRGRARHISIAVSRGSAPGRNPATCDGENPPYVGVIRAALASVRASVTVDVIDTVDRTPGGVSQPRRDARPATSLSGLTRACSPTVRQLDLARCGRPSRDLRSVRMPTAHTGHLLSASARRYDVRPFTTGLGLRLNRGRMREVARTFLVADGALEAQVTTAHCRFRAGNLCGVRGRFLGVWQSAATSGGRTRTLTTIVPPTAEIPPLVLLRSKPNDRGGRLSFHEE